MTDNTTLIQSFAKRLVEKNGRELSGNPSSKTDHDCSEVHPGLSHSQWEFAKWMRYVPRVGTPAYEEAPVKQQMPAYEGGMAPIFGQGHKSLNKELPGVWCDWCHTGPYGVYVPYRGQKVCRKCMAERGRGSGLVKNTPTEVE
jgi:hypothetical protein